MMSCRVALIFESLTKLCNWQEKRNRKKSDLQVHICTCIYTVCNATQAAKQFLNWLETDAVGVLLNQRTPTITKLSNPTQSFYLTALERPFLRACEVLIRYLV